MDSIVWGGWLPSEMIASHQRNRNVPWETPKADGTVEEKNSTTGTRVLSCFCRGQLVGKMIQSFNGRSSEAYGVLRRHANPLPNGRADVMMTKPEKAGWAVVDGTNEHPLRQKGVVFLFTKVDGCTASVGR